MARPSSYRSNAKSRYEHRYAIFRIGLHEEGWTRCFYCGSPADTVDHQPPLSRVNDYEALGLEFERYVKVLACIECNVLLGNDLHETLMDREFDLKQKLRKKYKKYLDLPVWKKPQLDMMGPRLRQEIRRSMRLKEAILERMQFAEGILDYMVQFEIEEMLR